MLAGRSVEITNMSARKRFSPAGLHLWSVRVANGIADLWIVTDRKSIQKATEKSRNYATKNGIKFTDIIGVIYRGFIDA